MIERETQIRTLQKQWFEAEVTARAEAAKYDTAGGDDGGNAHAYRKEARIWMTCRQQLEALLSVLTPPRHTPECGMSRVAATQVAIPGLDLSLLKGRCTCGVAPPRHEAPKEPEVKGRIDRILQRVAELPDRASPEDWPEAMLVTGVELEAILMDELQPAALTRPAASPHEEK